MKYTREIREKIKEFVIRNHTFASDQLLADKLKERGLERVSQQDIKKIRRRFGLKRTPEILANIKKKSNVRGPDTRERREGIRLRIKREGHEERLKAKMFG